MNFVFFHVGDVNEPSLLVKSIRKFNTNANIIFLTDKLTKNIDEVDETLRFDGDKDNLMTFRLKCFADLKLRESAIYIDSDVLFVKSIDDNFFNNKNTLCLRTAYFDTLFNENNITYKRKTFPEFIGRTLGDVFPYLACFTYTNDYEFWESCYEYLETIDPKYHTWFGDQVALKEIYQRFDKKLIQAIPEIILCATPEIANKQESISIHFKGPKRKPFMAQVAHNILNID